MSEAVDGVSSASVPKPSPRASRRLVLDWTAARRRGATWPHGTFIEDIHQLTPAAQERSFHFMSVLYARDASASPEQGSPAHLIWYPWVRWLRGTARDDIKWHRCCNPRLGWADVTIPKRHQAHVHHVCRREPSGRGANRVLHY